MRLFKSHRDGIADGEQRRDFIYVDDVVAVMMWLLATTTVSGIFNVGTGKARSFKDLMLSAYRGARHAGRTSNISTCRVAYPRQLPVFHPGQRGSAAPGRLFHPVHTDRGGGEELRELVS